MRGLVIILFAFIHGSCLAQSKLVFPTFDFKDITTKENITNKIINNIVQDKNGLIWVATEDGLNRLDGFRTKQFYYDPLEKKSLSNSSVRSLLAVDNKNVWIGATYGLNKYNYDKNEITRIDTATNILNNGIMAFLKHQNKLWVLGSTEYYAVDNNQKIKRYKYESFSENENNYFSSIAKDRYNNIWAVKGNCLFQLDTTSLKTIDKICFGINERRKLLTFSIDKDECWIGTMGSGLVKMNIITKIKTGIKLNSKNVYEPKLYIDNNNNKWIIAGIDNGYAIINTNTLQATEIITGLTITNTFIDKEKGVWLGSNNGLLYAKNPNPYINNIIFANVAKNTSSKLTATFGLPGKITTTNNNYYVPLVFGNGIITFNKNWQFQQHTASIHTTSNNFKYIGNVLQRGNTKWVATRGGLAKCDTNLKLQKVFVPVAKNAISVDVQKMRDLIPLNDSEIVIKSFSAVYIFNTKKEMFTKSFFTTTDGKYKKMDAFIAEVVIMDRVCYMATEFGLLALHIDTEKIDEIELPNNNKRLSCITEKNKKLWIGSQKGLTSYDTETRLATTYYRKDGLSNDNILFMKLGVENKLWLATSNGLCCFDIETKKSINIFEKDGLVENYMQGEIFVDDKGNVVVGNSKGLDFIHKDIAKQTNNYKPCFITEILVNNNPTNWYYKNSKKYISLSQQENNVSIYFAMANGTKDEIYFYKLNNTWYNSTTGLVQLSSLAAGTYNLQVSSEPLDNILNDFITIIIKPPYYKTWWFILLCASCVGGLLYFFYRIRIRNVRHEALIEKTYQQKLSESEMQTLRSQMNPHFMFNTLNSINSYIIQNKPSEASEYLTTFSKLMRNILELSKQEKVTIEKELNALKMYIELEALRLENKFDYSIIVDKNIEQQNTYLPSLIIQPFVENAIWHGLHNKQDVGHIGIHVGAQNEQIIITIEDDGIGRTAAAALKKQTVTHKSFGIDITINRIKILDPQNTVTITDLYSNANKAIGTKVIITINSKYND